MKFILGILLLAGLHSSAQQFSGYPSSTKWKQIDTDTVRIIFTKGGEVQANRIATLIHNAAADTSFALGKRLKKVDIVLHSQTTQANGYVALAPFRSEFYLVPSSNVFDFGNLPWNETLAIHEFRHVQQFNNFKNGPTKAFYVLFGEQGQAFANAISIPDWFFEGDAVHSETALTPQGRGRLPYFLSGFNSLWLEGKNYSWQKLRNGSLKDYVPDHYQLGYLLTNYGYQKYGADFWEKVTADASAFKGLFYPFQKAIEKYSGVDYKTFRKEAFDFYRKDKLKYVNRQVTDKGTVSYYYHPQFISEDSILYLKSAYNKISAFYIKDKTGEHKISQKNISSEDWFSHRNGTIAYTAYSTNPRWAFLDYSDIVLLDINTKLEKRITQKSKYYTPDISPGGDKIVAININDSLESQLQILNIYDGRILKTIQSENGLYFTNPRFVDDNRIITGVRTADAKMSLQLIDLNSNKWQEIIPYSNYSISLPFVQGDSVYFTANFFENDDLYAVNIRNKNIYQLTRRFTGTYYPSVHNDSLAYSFFTSNGLQLQHVDVKKTMWARVNVDSLQFKRSMYPVALAKNMLNARTERFSTKRYDKSTGLFNFHSWSPGYSDPEFTFSLYGDNILNTFSNELFYRFNQNETSHGLGWNTSYGGLFPVINGGLEYTYDRKIKTTSSTITFNQFEARLGYHIPFDLTKGKTYKLLNFGSNYVFNRSMPTGFFKDSFEANNVSYLHHFLNLSHFLPRARQHIYPKFGYTLSPAYRHLLSDEGFQFIGNAQLFLPSIANHSLVISGSFQETDTSNRVFGNRFSNSRGYTDYYFSRMWKLGANYHLPLFYPDLGLASIVYFQRVRANLFYDHSTVFSNNKLISRRLRSTGVEIYFDTKWWNQLPVSFGFRVSHLLDNGFNNTDKKGANWFEFILPLDLIPN